MVTLNARIRATVSEVLVHRTHQMMRRLYVFSISFGEHVREKKQSF